MRIGQLAQLSGLSTSRIRFYEASGLLKIVKRKANGYRDYPPEAVFVLEIITGAQNAGFSLDEIRHLLPATAQAWQHQDLLIGLKQKVADIEALQKRLEQSKAQLMIVIESIENAPQGVACSDKPQWVLNRFRREGLI